MTVTEGCRASVLGGRRQAEAMTVEPAVQVLLDEMAKRGLDEHGETRAVLAKEPRWDCRSLVRD